jgi:hypothetical protein
MKATCLCLIVFGTSLAAAAGQTKSPASKVLTVAPESTVRYPDPWRPSGVEYSNAKELIFVSREKEAEGTSARILITTEQRLNHEDALQRLRDIAKSRSDGTVRFVEIGGWPGVVLEFIEPLPARGAPQRGEGNESEGVPDNTPVQHAIVAVAAGTMVVHFDISLAPGAPQTLLQQAEDIASSSSFLKKGNPDDVRRSILDLQHSTLKPPAREQPAPGPPIPQPHRAIVRPPNLPAIKPDKGLKETGRAASVEGGRGELEVVASSDATDIVIASNRALAYSNNNGSVFNKGSTGVFGLNDPSLARGASGNFYLGVIANPRRSKGQQKVIGCTNAVSRSTTRGASFFLQGYSVTCPLSGSGLCFPDQPHIAADSVNAASEGDQIYAVWRNFTPLGTPPATCGKIGHGSVAASITCSVDNGAHWTSTAAIPGAGDYPRTAVGKDGNVYVVTLSGSNVLLNRFSSCSTGLAPAAGFPVTVATLTGKVACPVPGLDRCNDGNTLSSPTAAPDPSDASHIFVSFAQSDEAGGEQIITVASTNSGGSFPRQSIVTTTKSIRRFMPWSCVTQGRSWVGWYDRTAANSSGATDDLTDYRLSSADGTQVGGSFNLTENPDPQCASGWPCAPRSPNDSESCTVQPQLAGRCKTSSGGGSKQLCDFSSTVCPTGERCQTGNGCPKYGDYNGIACAGDYVIAAWSSATAPKGLPAVTNGIRIFSSVLQVGPSCSVSTDGCAGQYSISVTCSGPNVGVKYPGCFDTAGEPTTCLAGFTNASTVTASWEGENTTNSGAVLGPYSGQVCTTDEPFQNCITINPAPVATACNRGDNPIQKCEQGYEWCAKWKRCTPNGQCTYRPYEPPK